MVRALRILACLAAVALGLAIPLLAFAQEPTAPSPASSGAAATTATAESTTTASTTTTTTGGSSSDGKGKEGAKGSKHRGAKEILGALVALLVIAALLGAINMTLKAEQPRRGRSSPAGARSKWYSRNPVPRFLLLGADGRWSTSRTLASLWMLSLVWSIATLAFSNLFGASEGWEAFEVDPVSWQYLLLLGGPVAAAIGAQTLTLLRNEAGEVKTEPPKGASFSQIYTDDEGNLDLIDVQYLAFNALSIAVFLVVFLANVEEGLPEFPGILAALTAATTAAYLARKAAFRASPSITSISPSTVAPGERVRLWGVNLTPAQEPSPRKGDDLERAWASQAPKIDVTFDGMPAAKITRATEQASDLSEAYDVWVPVGASIKAKVAVVVNSRGAYGRKSAAYDDFEIVAPALTNASPPRVKAGGLVKIWGTRLKYKDEKPQVFFDDVEGEVVDFVYGADSSQHLMRVRVPELAIGTVKLKAITGGGLSTGEMSLEIAAEVRILDAPKVLSLCPRNPELLIKGEGFFTGLGTPAFASVHLDGTPLEIKEGSWRRNEVTALLPTSPARLKSLGFADKSKADLVVRNDEGQRSEPWELALQVVEPEEKEDEPEG
jgi:hypothetical protein